MNRIQELEDRVSKAIERVTRCKETIKRHEKQLEKKKAAGDEYGAARKQDDIKGATRKLQEAEATLAKWQEKLNVEIEKERFLEGNAPQAIKDFLEQWKQRAFEWHIRRYRNYLSYKVKLQKEVEATQLEYIKTSPDYVQYVNEDGTLNQRFDWIVCRPNRGMDKYLQEKGLDYRSIKKKEMNFAGAAVLRMCEFRYEHERQEWLERELEMEKKAKMLDLVHRINKAVGAIVDATGLRISAKGNLDGVILGTDGRAKIETVSAGGWNIQCFHYRTLVHKL